MKISKAVGIAGILAVFLMYSVPYTFFAHGVRDLSLYFYWLGLAAIFMSYAIYSLDRMLRG